MPNPRKHEVRECVIIEVIRVHHTRGSGFAEDPMRIVTVWYTKEGHKIAECDPFLDDKS